ncbi:hypothetical protein [Parasitella parasitica]|uniref:RING-type domain-containing protein n=1 Tax=Parasitella parasitica TaxID=35722 RepID=A0A0B7N3F5_9FUNG|nr:hypothetical protein [Parasitella parasitica]
MGQSSSVSDNNRAPSSRHDNASTRTLHSTSIHSSQRPVSFFRRISNRLHATHPARRFSRPGRHNRQTTSASWTTSSVRRATQEATRQPAAATGPPTNFLIQVSTLSSTTPSPPPLPSSSSPPPTQAAAATTAAAVAVPLNSSRNSIMSSDTQLNDLLSSTTAVFRDNNSVHSSSHESQRGGNSFVRYLQVPLRMQDTPPQSSASSTTSRRMHILVIEYRTNNNNSSSNNGSIPEDTTAPLTPPPTHRFLGLRRPRSQVSTTSSTETIQSMPLSMNSAHTNHRNTPHSHQEGQWIVYVLNSSNSNGNGNGNNTGNGSGNGNSTPLQSSPFVLDDNPTYEDLLWLTNMLGPVRLNTVTQAAVDEAIPVTQWSNEIKDDQCLVCLDEFAVKQPVRVLKCHHVFHRECVDRWLCEAHNSCPVCRGVPV